MCFSLPWLESLAIYLVILVAVFAVVRLLVPYVLSLLPGGGGVIAAIIQIALWVVVAIFAIRLIFSLLSCAGGF